MARLVACTACTTNPINAGPSKSPAYPIVVIAETAMLSGISFCLPANQNMTGTMFEQQTPSTLLDWSAVFLAEVHGMSPAQAGLGYAAFAATMTVGRLSSSSGSS